MLLYEAPGHGGLRVVAYAPCLGAHADEPAVSSTDPVVVSAPRSGIRPGMPLAEALALAGWSAQRSIQAARRGRSNANDRRPASRAGNRPDAARSPNPPALCLEAYDPWADRLALAQLAEWCRRFTPTAGLEQAERPDCLFLDITGLAPLYGGEPVLAEQVQRAFYERGLTARLAIADTPGAAWALAHYMEGAAPSQPIIAPAGQALSALARLPITALRLPDQTVAWLAELGMITIGQVAALPRSSLRSRFGEPLLARLDQATGAASEVIVAHKAAAEFQAEWPFEHPVERREAIDLALAQLLARLAESLAGQRLGAMQLECRLDCEGEPVRFSLGLYRPSASARHLLELVQLRLESLRLPGPVAAVHLGVTAAAPLTLAQQELFAGDGRHDAPRHLAALVDRLSSRLGREAVLRPCLLADAQPEYVCQFVPCAGTPPPRRSTGRAPAARHSLWTPGQRPLRLTLAPQPLAVTAVVPQGPPIRFQLDGQSHSIARAWGPERIETGWWRSRCVRRDYYRVETASGQRFWLFRRCQDGQWFLHGEFD